MFQCLGRGVMFQTFYSEMMHDYSPLLYWDKHCINNIYFVLVLKRDPKPPPYQ